tara:strand:+ start:30 stop:422 length:393 start_codon:yes stop_codon:yes gene_type:complete
MEEIMEVNVDVQVNKAVHTTEEGSFLSAQVYFNSTIATSMALDIEKFMESIDAANTTLIGGNARVNLSRKGHNPNCDMRMDKLDAHDHHAPTFSSLSDMANYISRVMDRVTEVVQFIDTQAATWEPKEVE